MKRPSETAVTVVLAEHLLGKLSPGGSYVIDKRLSESGGDDGGVDKTGKCECLCDRKIPFGDTGIGKLKVEHVPFNFASYMCRRLYN